MREIKFRAWDKGVGAMVRSDMLSFRYHGTVKEFYIEDGYNGFPLKDPVLMQYTGLKDNDDEKEVYEHDIVQFAIFDYNGANTQYTGVVKFSDGQWQLWKSADDPYYGSDGPFNMHMVCHNDDGFKVIGNIYESPSLIGTTE